jgi:hypothetical protein
MRILHNPFPWNYRFNGKTKDRFMALPKYTEPDRRSTPRIKVHLDCQVIFEENEYDAVIQDISLKGAFLWSSIMPPHDSVVSLRLKPSPAKQPIILNGNVVRRDSKYKEHGKAGAFAITFSHNSPALLQSLGNKLKP